MSREPVTLSELLLSRATLSSSAGIGYLDSEGTVAKSQSYSNLYHDASKTACKLLSSGLSPETDIVITSFPDHESHILAFWSCCLAGIRICPIPPLHPDPSSQAVFFNHLKNLFHNPTILTNDEMIFEIKAVAPEIKCVTFSDIKAYPSVEPAQSLGLPGHGAQPDDIVCFMLTSGSTGNCKAVALRHSNLLSSVRGKIKHHGSSSSSRFLNWIAFHHVACLSEAHIQAMQVDAWQYHVAPSFVLQHPCNLLNWCSELEITYTFSPNFLIAQMARDVSTASFAPGSIDLSSLKAFISGGEAVPIRTAVEFSDLLERHGAPRDCLRAGFGMSETGAGCIYDTRPTVRDPDLYPAKYLSLGKCCDGTAMRVVSPSTGEICAVGETGQLQIKGSTVFREYYNDPRATSESFSSDGWFITGDNAQLDHDGNLHLTGREKDFININGVKHPSVDIEHFIEDNEIEGVMRSFVYACPMRLADSDTETYAIFFQHTIPVEDELGVEDKITLNQARRGIRNACIVFASQAPHVVLPLPRKCFSKTALGKVSRSTLVSLYSQGMFAPLEATLKALEEAGRTIGDAEKDAVESVVFESIASVFNLEASTINPSQTLFDIGASSMHLVRLKHILQERLGVQNIPMIEMLRRPGVDQLCDYVRELSSSRPDEGDPSPPREYSPLICLHPGGSKPPLFLVHPGIGEIFVFIQLAHVLEDDRAVYALRARGFDADETTFESFEEMTDIYTSAIEKVYPDGPYFIAGYSFGGSVAFEIGKKLESHGRPVAWIGVLNLPPHIQFRMKELTWTEVIVNIFMFLALIPATALESTKHDLFRALPEVTYSDDEPPCAIAAIEWLFGVSDKERLQELKLSSKDLRKWAQVAYGLSYLGRGYLPSGAVKGALTTIFCATPLPSMGDRLQYKQNHLSAWRDFSGDRLEFIDVDGEHYTMLSEDHVETFSQKLREALQRASSPPLPNSLSLNGRKGQLHFDEVPTIDFSLAEREPAVYIEQLRHALEDVGFGVFINVPGFEDGFQKEIFALAEQIFSMPRERKDALGTSRSYALRGYFHCGDIPEPHKAHAEAFRFGLDLPEPVNDNVGKIPFWLRLHEGPNQWPSETDIPRFRGMMETLFSRYHSLNLILNRHICRLLDIPQATLDDYFPEKTEFNSAIWHYFPVTPQIHAAARNGFAQGMHEHCDPSTFLTCLIQSRPGLQVRNHRGEWIDVPRIEGGVVCNIGMQLMKLTGGKLVATAHRVNTLKIDKDRYTIPYVLSTKLDKPVVPLRKYGDSDVAKSHAAPNPRTLKLMAIEDPLVRSGYARLSLFPAATQKLYPEEFKEAQRLGIL